MIMTAIAVMAAVIVSGIAYGAYGREKISYNRIGVEGYVSERGKCYKFAELRGLGAWRKFSPAEMIIHGVLRQGLPNTGMLSREQEFFGLNDTRKYIREYMNN